MTAYVVWPGRNVWPEVQQCLNHAHATTFLQFNFSFQAEDAKNCLAVTFVRRTSTMPQPPKVGHTLFRSAAVLGC